MKDTVQWETMFNDAMMQGLSVNAKHQWIMLNKTIVIYYITY